MQRPGLSIRLVMPGNVRHNSGGNVYNAALARELAVLGAEVETCPCDGDWPVGSAGDRRRLAGLLRTPAGAGRSVILVDGLLGCGAPAELEAAAAAGQPVWILLHMPLGGHPYLERRALNAAAGVICTSGSAAAGIRARHGFDGARVALPGTDAALPAPGSEPPHLVAVAALLPNKSQLLLLEALARLKDLAWTASLIGSDATDPAYAAQLRERADSLGLTDRVRIPGELRGPAMEAEWAAADLSLLISRAETYGLVVTESLARGVPVVVREGTGAVEALAAGERTRSRVTGCLVDDDGQNDGAEAQLPGAAVLLAEDPAPLADLLRRWLTEPGLRARWRDAATAARGRLPGWDATARTVLAAVGPDVSGKPGASIDSAGGQAVGQ